MHRSQFIIQFRGRMGKTVKLWAALAAVHLADIGILAGGTAIAKAKI